MTLQECYVKIGGDYNDILHRFMNENMIHKFVLKFPQDNNMALFEESWAKKDYETAFRAMHTLKGVPSICGTLLSRIILRIAGVIVMISNTGTCFPSTVGTNCCEITACNTMDS